MTPSPPHRHRGQVLGSRSVAPPVEVAQQPRRGAACGRGSSTGWHSCGPGIATIDLFGTSFLIYFDIPFWWCICDVQFVALGCIRLIVRISPSINHGKFNDNQHPINAQISLGTMRSPSNFTHGDGVYPISGQTCQYVLFIYDLSIHPEQEWGAIIRINPALSMTYPSWQRCHVLYHRWALWARDFERQLSGRYWAIIKSRSQQRRIKYTS